MSENEGNSTGIGSSGMFVGMLSTLFIGLKLGDIIDWSWWWVLSPIWISGVIVVFLIVCWLWLDS